MARWVSTEVRKVDKINYSTIKETSSEKGKMNVNKSK